MLRNTPEVSVIICSNRPAGLFAALESVLSNRSATFELIVVAQGAAPLWNTPALVAALDAGRLRVVHDSGRGLSRARNIGIAAAKGEFLLFTDDDCKVAPDWVESHLAVYRERPDVAMVFGPVLPPDSYTGEGTVPTFDPEAARGTACNRGRFVLGMGANMSLRRSTVDRVGLFDEEIGAGAPLASGEDMDYALRTSAQTLLVVGDPRPSVVHEGGVRPRGSESSALWKRDGIGFGAVAAKCLRAKDWGGALTLGSFLASLGSGVIAATLARRSPSGARQVGTLIGGALFGMALGLRYPLSVTDRGVRFSRAN